jgi:hypothetical protein
MDGFVDFITLICAVTAALAAGLLLGYAACKALFALCSVHARSVFEARNSTKTEARTVNA